MKCTFNLCMQYIMVGFLPVHVFLMLGLSFCGLPVSYSNEWDVLVHYTKIFAYCESTKIDNKS